MEQRLVRSPTSSTRFPRGDVGRTHRRKGLSLSCCPSAPARMSAAGDGASGSRRAHRSGPICLAILAVAFHVNCNTSQSTDNLIAAMEKGQTAKALQLISSGADVNGKDVSGMTPLMHAAMREQPELARALVAAAADVNARQGRWYWVFGRNDTALVWCARRGAARVAEVLLTLVPIPGSRPATETRWRWLERRRSCCGVTPRSMQSGWRSSSCWSGAGRRRSHARAGAARRAGRG